MSTELRSPQEEMLWDAVNNLQAALSALRLEFDKYREQHSLQHMVSNNVRLDHGY